MDIHFGVVRTSLSSLSLSFSSDLLSACDSRYSCRARIFSHLIHGVLFIFPVNAKTRKHRKDHSCKGISKKLRPVRHLSEVRRCCSCFTTSNPTFKFIRSLYTDPSLFYTTRNFVTHILYRILSLSQRRRFIVSLFFKKRFGQAAHQSDRTQ